MKPLTYLLALLVVVLVGCSATDMGNGNDTDNETNNTSYCTLEYDPVCGTVDGRRITFGNDCEADNAGAQDITPGECIDEDQQNFEGACLSFDGRWLEDFQECEGMGQQMCEDLGGEFVECGSACRHDPDAEVCTLQCVSYCDFSQVTGSGGQIVAGDSDMQTVEEQQAQCESEGGEMIPCFTVTGYYCSVPTTDAGQTCTDSSQCEAECIAPASCEDGTAVDGEVVGTCADRTGLICNGVSIVTDGSCGGTIIT